MLLLAAAAFVGSAACRPCHPQISADYAKTQMARSSGPVTSVAPATFTAAGHNYQVTGNRLSFPGGTATIDFFIGSGAEGRSYLFSRDGFLFELPVTFYQRRGWDASPGYEHEAEVRLNRPVDPTCLYCHASRLQPIYGTQNKYADLPFLEAGVACERCHGPGGDHVKNPRGAPMANPAQMAPEARDSVCAQCHLTADARIERPGQRFAAYRPGDKLSDYVTYFVWASKRPGVKVTSHVENLALSACKRAAGDALWCGTCHDPHTNANRTEAACLSCHAQAHHQEESCVGCHMPEANAVDAAHGVFTDHSIRRLPAAPVAAKSFGELTALLGKSDDRSIGLAYAELDDARALPYLKRASPADAPVLLRLAGLEKDAGRAAEMYHQVLTEEPANAVALVNLGVIYASAGRTRDAAALWQRALDTNPALEGGALNLARVLPAPEARRILDRYLSFNPGSIAAQSARRALR